MHNVSSNVSNPPVCKYISITEYDKELAYAESCFGNGVADYVSGDVESPTGHYYRVECNVIVTDSYGFTCLYAYSSIDKARQAVDYLDSRYEQWLSNNDEGSF